MIRRCSASLWTASVSYTHLDVYKRQAGTGSPSYFILEETPFPMKQNPSLKRELIMISEPDRIAGEFYALNAYDK